LPAASWYRNHKLRVARLGKTLGGAWSIRPSRVKRSPNSNITNGRAPGFSLAAGDGLVLGPEWERRDKEDAVRQPMEAGVNGGDFQESERNPLDQRFRSNRKVSVTSTTDLQRPERETNPAGQMLGAAEMNLPYSLRVTAFTTRFYTH